jgi:hypothetical protein
MLPSLPQAVRNPDKKVEVVGGDGVGGAKTIPLVTPSEPPPKTFTAPPKKKKVKKWAAKGVEIEEWAEDRIAGYV